MRRSQKSEVRSQSWWLAVCSLALLFSGSMLSARTAVPAARPKGRRFDVTYLAKNQWRMAVSNYGMFGHDATRNSSGGEWPRGSGNMYIYGAGLWFGRRTNNNADTNTTVGYNPNSGKAEFTPGAWENAPGGYSSRDYERVYSYPEDWPPNPTDFPESMRDSTPTSLKIPIPGGDTIRGMFYPIPRKTFSTGDLWSVYNDRDPANMEPNGRAIGLEIYQSSYAWGLPSNRDVVFFTYTIRNVSSDTIKDAYMGIACDADIGGANNDYAGLILSRYVHNPEMTESLFVNDVGMTWSDAETGWEDFPGVVAFDFLQSPFKKDSLGRVPGIDGIDNNGNGLIDEPAEGEQIGMTAYKIFTLQAGDPAGDGKQYLALQGKEWWVTPPTYNPYDSLDNTPNDKRFLQSTGPFALAPDSMVTVTVACMAAPLSRLPSDRDTSFWRLAIVDNAAQTVYNNNWLSPQPPPSPSFVLQPGDGKVTIMWDNLPESARDPYYPLARTSDPFYREQDFQGYKIYRSQSGKIGEWRLLTQFDLRDGIVFEDSTVADSIRSKATDNGLVYAYVDRDNIRYGFPYYYAVTSFDYNTLGLAPDTVHLTLESGMLQQATTTRTEPENYEPATATVEQTVGNARVKALIAPLIIAPQAIRQDVFDIKFLPITLGANYTSQYGFCILRSNGDTASAIQNFSINPRKFTDTVKLAASIFDSVVTRIHYDTAAQETIRTKGWLPTIQVDLQVKLDSIPEQSFDSIHVTKGSYPSTKFGFPASSGSSTYNYIWPYRGCDYRIVWLTAPNGKLTAKVTDLVIDEDIGYKVIPMTPARPESASGWCFYDSLGPTKLRSPSDTITAGKTKFLIINGSMIELNRGRTMDADTLPAPGDTWTVFALRYSAAPANATFRISTEAMRFDAKSATLNVKAVPNPYLVHNEWERHPDYRKLKFINLPNRCTIRIYTMAGELIRTIEHRETNVNAGNVENQLGGDEDWDLLSGAGKRPAPGIYLFHIESDIGEQLGKLAIVY